MLHYAQGLAASPHGLYKLFVGRRGRLPFYFWPPRALPRGGSAALSEVVDVGVQRREHASVRRNALLAVACRIE